MARRILMICMALMLVCIAASSVLAAAADNTLTSKEQKARWKLLFDGKTLTGWKATGKAEGWAVEDGVIADLTKGGGVLATDQTFGNFRLSAEFKMDKGTNSGIFFRWADLKDPVQTGIELQILDSNGKQPPDVHDCGAIYDCLAPSAQACKPAGEWNKVILTARDNKITVNLNGKRVINMDLNLWTTAHKNPDGTANKFNTAYKDMPKVGHIGLQDHGHKVWFKNIKIKTL